MTNNADLLPGQLVDVEFRQSRPALPFASTNAWIRRLAQQRLQVRKLLKSDSGELTWTDWADVPVVEEG